jgi:hypothetical protein
MVFPLLPDQRVCDGCTQCRHRCTAGIPLTRAEYSAISDFLTTLPPERRDRILSQSKRTPWPGASDGETYEACRFLDVETGLCLVYPVRPLVCRLFGYVVWLPCPIGAVESVWPPGVEAMASRADEPQWTWEEWRQKERADP